VNISEGFGRAAQSLGQWANISANRDMQELRDLRAENLARFQIDKQHTHDLEISDRQIKAQKEITDRTLKAQAERDEATGKRQHEENEYMLKRYGSMADAQMRNTNAREDAATERQRQQLISENRRRIQQLSQNTAAERRRLQAEYGTLAASYRRDQGLSGDALVKAIASDPQGSQLAQQMRQLEMDHANGMAELTLQGADLGDNLFRGKNDDDIAGGGVSPDDTEATDMPQMAGMTPPPRTSKVGPLKPNLQLIPTTQSIFGAGTPQQGAGNAPNLIPGY